MIKHGNIDLTPIQEQINETNQNLNQINNTIQQGTQEIISSVSGNTNKIINKMDEQISFWSGELLSPTTITNESGDTILNEDNIVARIFKGIWQALFQVDPKILNETLQFMENIIPRDNVLYLPIYLLDKIIHIFIDNIEVQDFIIQWQPLEYQGIQLFDNNGQNYINFSLFIRENETAKQIYDIYIIIINIGWVYLFANWMRSLWLDIISVNWLGNQTKQQDTTDEKEEKRDEG